MRIHHLYSGPDGEAHFGDIEIEHRTVESFDIVYLATRSAPESAAIATALGDAYFKLLNFIDQNELRSSVSVFDEPRLIRSPTLPSWVPPSSGEHIGVVVASATRAGSQKVTPMPSRNHGKTGNGQRHSSGAEGPVSSWS